MGRICRLALSPLLDSQDHVHNPYEAGGGCMISGTRLWVTLLMLAAATILLYGRGDKDVQVNSEPMAQFPKQIDHWTGRDRGLDPRVLEVLGHGDFLSRLYTSDTAEPPIDLFIGYFPSQ